MPELNRRKSDEDRRKTRRFAISIDVEWENHNGRRSGTLSDISEEGCFVLSEVDVSDGELVKIFIPLSDGMQVEFLGQVANFVYEIGFAVYFLSLSESQKEFLSNFVEMHSTDTPA
ncbi:MAG TPA: PilZ domain-containing protein [Pyrinomonadaceae bacterium]|nr:PilZ domain-containing protein [Pyrinomonadaceae bacterium]